MTPTTQFEKFRLTARALETDRGQERIGRSLLSHVEKLRALRAEVDKGIASLDAGQGKVQHR
jgi:hypothetical protein